jgi:glycine cleavage system H protein
VAKTATAPQRQTRVSGLRFRKDYCFHLGHTWVTKEGVSDARVGVDKFVTNLMGKIDHVDVRGADRWVRQGQKLITLTSNGTSVDLLSPVEGVVVAVNDDVLRDPSVLTSDPYQNGWIAIVKSVDLKINQRNLIQGSMVAPWMQNNVARLSAMVSPSPALAQDGGQSRQRFASATGNPELRQTSGERVLVVVVELRHGKDRSHGNH